MFIIHYVYKNDYNTNSKLERGAEGPLQVTNKINSHVFEVKDVTNGVTKQAHIERMKPFARDIELNEVMKSHIARNSPDGYIMDRITNISKKKGKFILNVGYKGLKDEEEFTWEELTDINKSLLRQYIKANKKNQYIKQALIKYKWKI